MATNEEPCDLCGRRHGILRLFQTVVTAWGKEEVCEEHQVCMGCTGPFFSGNYNEVLATLKAFNEVAGFDREK